MKQSRFKPMAFDDRTPDLAKIGIALDDGNGSACDLNIAAEALTQAFESGDQEEYARLRSQCAKSLCLSALSDCIERVAQTCFDQRQRHPVISARRVSRRVSR